MGTVRNDTGSIDSDAPVPRQAKDAIEFADGSRISISFGAGLSISRESVSNTRLS